MFICIIKVHGNARVYMCLCKQQFDDDDDDDDDHDGGGDHHHHYCYCYRRYPNAFPKTKILNIFCVCECVKKFKCNVFSLCEYKL